MKELTGANSHRLILAGMLTEISVEHYRWVSGGDILNPAPSGATERDSVFLKRLAFLFDEGGILNVKTCYTAEVLRFLEENRSYGVGTSVAVLA